LTETRDHFFLSEYILKLRIYNPSCNYSMCELYVTVSFSAGTCQWTFVTVRLFVNNKH